MAYQLYSIGRLVDGVDEQQALQLLQQITKMPEETIRSQLIAGQRRRLASGDDRENLEQLYNLLLEAGLDVELLEDGQPLLSADGTTSSQEMAHPDEKLTGRGYLKSLLVVAGVLLLLAIAAAGYGWYWINHPLNASAQLAENALADGKLVAIGYADINRITLLKKKWLGSDDPGALPDGLPQPEVWGSLLSGPVNVNDNLHDLFFAVHATNDQNVATTLLLVGHFEEATILKSFKNRYELTELGNHRWSLQKKSEQDGAFTCPAPDGHRPPPVSSPTYLQVAPQWVMLASNQENMARIALRLQNPATSAAQDLTNWHSYRRGQLASLMIFIPREASKMLHGFPGMIAQKVTADTPQVTSIAARLGLAPLHAGLHADLRIASRDQAWNMQKADALTKGIAEWMKSGSDMSDGLNKLLSRISVEGAADHLQIGLALDSAMLSELGDTVQETTARLFTLRPKGSAGQDNAPPHDEIMKNPIDYAATQALAQLPPYETNYSFEHPLFVEGSFAVSPEYIERNKEGLFKIQINGKVALPKPESSSVRRSGHATLRINDVVDRAGTSLLRDERCIKMQTWGGRNNEAAESDSTYGERISLDKTVRLRQGAMPQQIAEIRGAISFSAPVQVKQLPVPLKNRSSVEYMGLRLFINHVGRDGSVSYQLSGAKERFLELRASNKDGKPLASDWWTSDHNSGRKTRHYQGMVKALTLYVAEKSVVKESEFTITNLFSMPSQEAETSAPNALKTITASAKEWESYTALNLAKLHSDPKDKDWHRMDTKNRLPIATLRDAPVTFRLYHKVEKWGNRPEAELYYPMLPAFPVTLSALSYRIDEPANKETGIERFLQVTYPYFTSTGKYAIEHQIKGKPFASKDVGLNAGLKENERLQHLKGRFRFRLPLATKSTLLSLDELWEESDVDGVTLQLTRIQRGMFPGYALKVSGELGKLVNLYGYTSAGERIAASPVNFQDGGYWTMTLPFNPDMHQVELVLASKQQIYDIPFDLKPVYPQQ